jgi:hypothetical protein
MGDGHVSLDYVEELIALLKANGVSYAKVGAVELALPVMPSLPSFSTAQPSLVSPPSVSPVTGRVTDFGDDPYRRLFPGGRPLWPEDKQ